MKLSFFLNLAFLVLPLSIYGSGWGDIVFPSFSIVDKTFEDTLIEFSDSVYEASGGRYKIDYALLPASVGFESLLSPGEYESEVDQLLGFCLRRINRIEAEEIFRDNKLTVSFGVNPKASSIAVGLFRLGDVEFQQAGECLIFQKNYIIKVIKIKVSEDLISIIKSGVTAFPFESGMFILIPDKKVLIVSDWRPMDAKIRFLREIEESLARERKLRENGISVDPYRPSHL